MTAVCASAPGKIILCGEHAVVYGQPALAAPVTQVQATAEVTSNESGIWIDARDLKRRYRLEEAPSNDPLAAAIRLTLEHPLVCGLIPNRQPSFCLTITATIPFAAGLGSGAAVCAAAARAVAAYVGTTLPDSAVAALVFETEKLLHGTPSGIDNTVIAYNRPIYFIKDHPPALIQTGQRWHLLIADTGIASPTKITVGAVRAGWQSAPARYEGLFAAIGRLVEKARTILEQNASTALGELGELLTHNHHLLQELDVSCPELDELVLAARRAGALGAKMSGGGRGGNMLALVTPETREQVKTALEAGGAKRVLETVI